MSLLTYRRPVQRISIVVCRISIALTGCHWFIIGAWPEVAVALASLGLTWAASALLKDPATAENATTLSSLLIAAHVVLGMELDLYQSSRLYDKVVHAIGSSCVALILIDLCRNYRQQHQIPWPRALSKLLVFCATLSVGVGWELFEFAIDRTGLFTAQRGLEDTMLDLLANSLGAAAALAALGSKPNQTTGAQPC